jgi:hypothetical protein
MSNTNICRYFAKEFEPPCGKYNFEDDPDTHWGWELRYCCADCIRLHALEDEAALAMLLDYPQERLLTAH